MMQFILFKRYEQYEMATDSERWIPGCLEPLRCAVDIGLPTKAARVPHGELIERLLDQAKCALDNSETSYAAFQTLLPDISYLLQSDSEPRTPGRLRKFT